jgi:superfamily II DNA or RNA helicase
MADIVIHKLNEALLKVECEKSIAQELADFFTFYVPGFQFTPQFKKKIWDGKIRLFNLRDFTIYHGLLVHILRFCEEREYKYEIDPTAILSTELSLIEAVKFVESLNLPVEVRDYQIKSFIDSIRNHRMLIVSPTASGKSLILYLIIRYVQLSCKKGLIVVPTTSLVEQMYSDFQSYGWDSEKYCHRQYAGKEKDTDMFLTITTWQSIYNREPEYFEQFDFVLGDEAHLFKAKSLITIMTGLKNCRYRIGCTGTLDGTKTHKLVLEGLFGPSKQIVTTKELIDRKQLASFRIKCLILKYPEESCKKVKHMDYNAEKEYIVMNTARNNFIKNLALSLEGNSLILFQLVEKHGKPLFDLIKSAAKNRKVFFVYGGTDVEVRESIRSITEKEKNAIIVASYGTFSTGINIRNLHNVVFASPSKSRIRNLQSIGRALRIGDGKDEAVLYDIADDLRVGNHTNTTLKHFIERVGIYDEEKFPYKFYNIELKNG